MATTASNNNINNNNNNNNAGLPVIPLSPLAQSYIIGSNALNLATKKLADAKKANPPVQVDVLRGLLENSRVETEHLNTLTRQMQSLESATALNWDADLLARQIALLDSQLYNLAFLDKRSLCQLDKEQSKLVHLVDFHHYLCHSVAHQLIYWAELLTDNSCAVVPPVHPAKDSLVTHWVRVAYLLLHAYRDFSGFAAIIKALTFPEVRRLNKRLWQNCNSRTKDMFRDLVQMVSPAQNYNAYHACLRTKLEMYANKSRSGGIMIAVPWIQPHLLSIRSIVSAYTAGDNEDPFLTMGGGADIVLSTPGAHKLDLQLAILELCQHNSSSSDLSLEDILGTLVTSTTNNKRASMAHHHNKAIHIEGLRAAVLPVPNLNHLAPGDLLTNHWLVSRVYLRKDQLINESMEVEPLKAGETISCDADDDFVEENPSNRFIRQQQQRQQPVVSNTTSRRTSFVQAVPRPVSVASSHSSNHSDSGDHPQPEVIEQELVDMSTKPTKVETTPIVDTSNSEEEEALEKDTTKEEQVPQPSVTIDESTEEQPPAAETKETPLTKPVEHEVTPSTLTPTPLTEQEPQNESVIEVEQPKQVESSTVEQVPAAAAAAAESVVIVVEEEINQEEMANSSSSIKLASDISSSASSSKQKSRLSPTAPEFVPGTSNYSQAKKADSVITSTTDEKWLGYPIREEDEEVCTLRTDSEKWGGYPVPSPTTDKEEEEEDEEVWKGYPGPNSSTDSPRRASSQSETSEEWKGYHATKIEADWQRESALKVQEHEWQGYALETLDEDELDSSTMMDGEFEKSRQARGQQQGNTSNEFRRKRRV
jgi:hypothetical protein